MQEEISAWRRNASQRGGFAADGAPASVERDLLASATAIPIVAASGVNIANWGA